MLTNEEAIILIEKFKKTKPNDFFNKVDDYEAGMRFVLIYLSENENVYANNIANVMGVSRARITVLLNKLENKGYIKKEVSATDKRIEVVSLTDSGFNYINQIKENILSLVIKLVDEIGIAEINSFLDTAAKIKKLLDNK